MCSITGLASAHPVAHTSIAESRLTRSSTRESSRPEVGGQISAIFSFEGYSPAHELLPASVAMSLPKRARSAELLVTLPVDS